MLPGRPERGPVAEKTSIIGFMPTAPTAPRPALAPAPASAPHRVVALALPGVVLLDLAAPTHLFGHCGGPLYAFAVAGVQPGPVATSTGLEITAPGGLE